MSNFKGGTVAMATVRGKTDRYGGTRIRFVRYDSTGWQDHTGMHYSWNALIDPVIVASPVLRTTP